MVPSVGASSPIIRSKKVDLPQPVCPTIATTSLGAMVRSSRSMATTSCPLVVWRNRLHKPRTSIGGGLLIGATRSSCAPPQQPRFDPRDDGFDQKQQRDQHDVLCEDVGDREQFLRHR